MRSPAYRDKARFNGAPYQNTFLMQRQAGINNNRIGADQTHEDSKFLGAPG